MKRVVVVCNAPNGLKEGLERNRAGFLGPADYLTTIAACDSHAIAAKVVSAYIANEKVIKDYDACAVVFVINGQDHDVDSLRLDIPGLLFVPVEFQVDRPCNRHFRDLCRQLRDEMFRVSKLARALRKEYRERDSRTPLLLPRRNFNSKALNRLLLDVQRLVVDGDYDVPLKKLLSAVAIRAVRESQKKSFFENKNALRFYGPSKAGPRHGKPFDKPPHDKRCLVNGYFRLGARYDIEFHYDCRYESGHIRRMFSNCHDEEEAMRGDYVNIAPNDALRY